MRSGKIEVVRHEGELLFKSPDRIMLDVLKACDFYSVNIGIMRNGADFDTGDVSDTGIHGPGPIFGGMRKILTAIGEVALNCHRGCSRLLPEYFEVGDELHFILNHPHDWEVDFRVIYAENQITEKLADREDVLMDFINDENFEKEYEAHMELFAQELDALVFPENPILRRRKK